MSRRLAVRAAPLVAALLLAACATDPGGDPERTGASRDEGHAVLGASLAAGTSVVIAAAGDVACAPGQVARGNRCRQAATARLVRSMRPAYVIGLGDLQYERGYLNAFKASYDKSWGTFRHKTWPVPGNHEYRKPGAWGYFTYFHGRTPRPPGYYRRAVNGWQIYLLNSNCEFIDCRKQRNWLWGQMAAHPTRCSLIAMHHPRYSSGSEHGNEPVARGFWRVALRFGADVSLAGHDHDYERFAAMDNDGAPSARGIQHFVSGAGGKNLYAKGRTVRGSRFFSNRRPGVLKLMLRPGGWSWQFRDIDNRLVDSGSRTCH